MSFENYPSDFVKTPVKRSENPKLNVTMNTDDWDAASTAHFFTNDVNDNSTKSQYFDMPLLDDITSIQNMSTAATNSYYALNGQQFDFQSSTNSLITLDVQQEDNLSANIYNSSGNASKDHYNNAPFIDNIESQSKMTWIPYNSKFNIDENLCSVSNGESIVNYCTTDDAEEISEFLVFHKTPPKGDDPKLKLGCFVKLEGISDQVRKKRTTKTIDRYCPSPKKRKLCRTIGTSSTSSRNPPIDNSKIGRTGKRSVNKRNTRSLQQTRIPKYDRFEPPEPYQKHGKIGLKFVRLENSTEYKCILLSTVPKVESEIERFVYPTIIKQSSELNENCEQTVPPDGDSVNSSDNYNPFLNCEKKFGFMEGKDDEIITKSNGAIENCDILRPPESFTTSPIQSNESYPDDQPLDLTVPKKNKYISKSREELLVKPIEFVPKHVEDMSPICNETRQSLTPDNLEDILNDQSSSDSVISEPMNSHQELTPDDNTPDIGVAQSAQDSDDASSVCSELSIFAPSLSEILNSPRAEDATPHARGSESKQNDPVESKKFRIPKIIRNVEVLEKKTEDVQTKVQKRGNSRDRKDLAANIKVMNSQDSWNEVPLEEIFRKTSKKSPAVFNSSETAKSTQSNSVDFKKNRNGKMEREKIVNPKNKRNLSLRASVEEINVDRHNNIKPKDLKDEAIRDCKPANTFQPEGVRVSANNMNEPLEETFRQSLNKSTFQSNKETISGRENLLIKVSNATRNISIHSDQNANTITTRIPPSLSTIQKPASMFPTIQTPIPSLLCLQMQQQDLFVPPTQIAIPTSQPIQENHSSLNRPLQKPLPSIQHLQLQKPIALQTSGCYMNINNETRKLYRSRITTMFEKPCITYLSNRLCISNCPFKHTLPSVEVISKKMINLPNEMIQFTYTDFIVKNTLSFIMYFPLICQLYGTRKLHSSLSGLIKDCEKLGKQEFFKFIFDGLVLCGLNKRDALLEIVAGCQVNGASDQFILQIIQTDPEHFIDILNTFVPRLQLNPDLLSHLLRQVVENPELSRLINCINLLEQIGETILNIDNDVLNTFCGAIFATGDDKLSTKILNIISNIANRNG